MMGYGCISDPAALGISSSFAINTDPGSVNVAPASVTSLGFSFTPESFCKAACEAAENCGGFYFEPSNGLSCSFQSIEQAQDPTCINRSNIQACSSFPGGDNCWWNGQWPNHCGEHYSDINGEGSMHWICVEPTTTDATTTAAPTTIVPDTTAPTTLPDTTAPTTLPDTTAPTTVPDTTAPTTVPGTTAPIATPAENFLSNCPSETWMATEQCMTDELCQRICSLEDVTLCPTKACECLDEFEEHPGFCCGGSCHDNYEQLWKFDFHNNYQNVLEDLVQWDRTTEGCTKLCHSFDRCDAFTVVESVRCEIVAGFDHYEPATDCETCFIKSNSPVETTNAVDECSGAITEVDISVGGDWDGVYALEFGVWKSDNYPVLHCCESSGTWGVNKVADACQDEYTYDEYRFNIGSCCVVELKQHLALITTTTTTTTTEMPTKAPTQAPVNSCCDLIQLSNLEGQNDREGIYYRLEDVYHDEWPVYKGSSFVQAVEQYLFYWAPIQDWVIGPDYEQFMGNVISKSNLVGCPNEFSTWHFMNDATNQYEIAPNAQAECTNPPPMARL